MLKYIVTICSISCCLSLRRQVGDYHQLIFAQCWPIAGFIEQQNLLPNENGSVRNTLTYLTEYWMVFNEHNWVIRRLWPISVYAHPPTFCQDYLGRSMIYDPETLPQTFKDELKIRWPVLKRTLTEDQYWAYEYEKYGSCITSYLQLYFKEAMDMLQQFNMARILDDVGIVPGNSYPLYNIISAITSILGTRPYVICLPPKNSASKVQYLLEVQICFNKARRRINCHYSASNRCDMNKTVIYSGWPSS